MRIRAPPTVLAHIQPHHGINPAQSPDGARTAAALDLETPGPINLQRCRQHIVSYLCWGPVMRHGRTLASAACKNKTGTIGSVHHIGVKIGRDLTGGRRVRITLGDGRLLGVHVGEQHSCHIDKEG